MAVVPTDEQQAVIDHLTGTVLVLAAVGSGKTTTL
jgi:superfamily I DNA/RNA helicase